MFEMPTKKSMYELYRKIQNPPYSFSINDKSLPLVYWVWANRVKHSRPQMAQAMLHELEKWDWSTPPSEFKSPGFQFLNPKELTLYALLSQQLSMEDEEIVVSLSGDVINCINTLKDLLLRNKKCAITIYTNTEKMATEIHNWIKKITSTRDVVDHRIIICIQ